VIIRKGITPLKSKACLRRNSNSFELSLLERQPNKRILNDPEYFDDYYLDFNKDYPLSSDKIIKAKGAIDFQY
jgi:hypothetical protein